MENVKIKKIKMPNTTVLSCIWIVIGLVLLVFPGQMLDMVSRIIGVVVLAGGILQIVLSLLNRGVAANTATAAIGIIVSLIGLFIIIRPDVLISILPFVAGVFLIIHSISSLINAISLAGSRYGYWWVAVLLSVLGIILGVILFFNAHSTAEFIARIIGLFLLYSGISSIWIASRKAHVLKLQKQDEDALTVDAKITDI